MTNSRDQGSQPSAVMANSKATKDSEESGTDTAVLPHMMTL